jgi:K+ transporter
VQFRLRVWPTRQAERMTDIVEAADAARHSAPGIPLPAALAALGIVYGDIGTSPLYAFKQAADCGGALSPETVTGIVSLILWSLIMIISVKYVILIMRADNRGKGGIVALLALLGVGKWHHAAHRNRPHLAVTCPGKALAERGWPRHAIQSPWHRLER